MLKWMFSLMLVQIYIDTQIHRLHGFSLFIFCLFVCFVIHGAMLTYFLSLVRLHPFARILLVKLIIYPILLYMFDSICYLFVLKFGCPSFWGYYLFILSHCPSFLPSSFLFFTYNHLRTCYVLSFSFAKPDKNLSSAVVGIIGVSFPLLFYRNL